MDEQREISSLASPEGRSFYRSLYHELRFEQQYSSWETLRTLWRIATRERTLRSTTAGEVTIRHPLGIGAGTKLWLEEIVSRYYYSTVLSFVYAGAALLLVVVGLRRFSSFISDTVVLLSVGLEALLLLVLFTVMFFNPGDDGSDPHTAKLEELIEEVGEIGRDYASVAFRLERATATLEQIARDTARLAEAAERSAQAACDAVRPNPELIPLLQSVNEALTDFKRSVEELTATARAIQREAIEEAVRAELARLVAPRVQDSTPPHS